VTQLRPSEGRDGDGLPHRGARTGGRKGGGGQDPDRESVRAHPLFASWYPKAAAANDRSGFAKYRARLVEGLRGEVVEIGPGSGLNFPHYPAEVTRVVAIEPEPRLRELAEQAARDLRAQWEQQAQREQPEQQELQAPQVPRAPQAPRGPQIKLIGGVAEDLPLPDAGFDAVVVSLALCSVRDQPAALAEIRRVLRPGGQFRFLEHVRARRRAAALAQRTLDATVWPLIGAGCRCARRTEQAVSAAGFEPAELERFRFPASSPVPRPTAPHVLGSAIRPLS
jgi:SAM-dependent methyltransferase